MACLIHLVYLVGLVYLVHLVCLVQPNNRDRPNRPDRPSNGLHTLADFCSIPLDHFSEVFDRANEGILELYLRFPFQESTRPTDIGPSDFGIIGRQRIVCDLAR